MALSRAWSGKAGTRRRTRWSEAPELAPHSVPEGPPIREGLLLSGSGDGGGRWRVELELPRLEERDVVVARLERLEPGAARQIVGQRSPGRHPPEPEPVVRVPARSLVERRHVDVADRAVQSLDLRAGPDEVPEFRRGADFDAADLLERKPRVLVLDDELQHGPDHVVAVAEVGERPPVQRPRKRGTLLLGLVEEDPGFGEIALADPVDGVQVPVHVGRRLVQEVGVQALREQAFAQPLGFDVRQIHLDGERLVRARLSQNLDLLAGAVPVAREREELEEKDARGAVGRVRPDLGRQGLDRRLQLTGLIEFTGCRHGFSSLLHRLLTGVRAVAILRHSNCWPSNGISVLSSRRKSSRCRQLLFSTSTRCSRRSPVKTRAGRTFSTPGSTTKSGRRAAPTTTSRRGNGSTS